ncbi:lysophospholipid acyltransferase family protein [Maribacter polysiphoniae]|uniref:1-acyl-sn-glycerol-3-phosphate acyltransferase n=1 Tax=Maribacter polysiphoniae TaxID=429344 RepID=A0A316E0W3_9FLAO|nr:lysophospholipid acyltransferase family protein [Maribacter polysiphoniae]MBD1260762.1 lysophospholipid acyltransferase family protein [Maribacter polysiphoniae]PWK24104.1 1-acyl-sn-glycerol-3-phosphate acyltransferase [Maribacter polysiphoniae]
MHTLAKFIYFKLLGWKIVGEFPDLKKCMLVVVPHTSWVDFFLGLLIRRVINKDMSFIAKKSLFKPPFGWYFRWMGGAPIDRSKSSDTVSAIAQIFEEKEVFRLALSPEGTRKKVDQWKTGFYYIAKAANVPIVLVAFDYGRKQIKFSQPYTPTENSEADFKLYREFFKGVVGKKPELS